MADNLRSITELPVLNEVPDGTYTVVVDGGTAKLAPYGGGAEAIKIVYTTTDMSECTCNMTYEEIYEALVVEEKMAVIEVSFGGVMTLAKSGLWSFMNGAAIGSETGFNFSFDMVSDFMRIVHTNDDTIAVYGAPQ